MYAKNGNTVRLNFSVPLDKGFFIQYGQIAVQICSSLF
jgi:hypothetical protein